MATLLSRAEAVQLTEWIKIKAGTIRDNLQSLSTLVEGAKSGKAHEVLGFSSWTAYLSETLGAQPMTLPRDERQALVGYLAGEGMSTRAIAPIVGASVGQVHADRSAGVQQLNRSLTVTGLDGKQYVQPIERVNTTTGGVLDPEPAQNITSAPRRRPLIDGFRDVSLDLGKLMTRIEGLVGDDRFVSNKNEVARYANDLVRARDALTRVIDQMAPRS